FGNPADIDAIIDLTRGRNIRVIDDAAQAMGAAIADRPVGSFGDAGIISFGSEKVCSGIGGGAAVRRYQTAPPKISKTELSQPTVTTTIKSLLQTIVWRRWRRWTLPLTEVLSDSELSPDLPPKPYLKESMANLQAALASSLIQTLRENLRARRSRLE